MNEPHPTTTRAARRENTRWWIKLVLQPIAFLAACIGLLVLLGVLQRHDYWTTGGTGSPGGGEHLGDTQYICPMMCVPPMKVRGRCPVCGMELVPASAGMINDDPLAVHIAPAARRIANIESVAARMVPAVRTVRAVGTLSYNESKQKTIAAYVAGRLDQLHVDYTGMLVEQGDPLAMIYSQELYSAQAELIEAHRGRRGPGLQSRLLQSVDLVGASKEKLRLLGLSDELIAELETQSEPSKHITIESPISGTVTAKLAAEGDYVRAGDPLLRVADLSTVWLMLDMFPDDAARAKLGQQVTALVASFPGEKFQGTVDFISPVVDSSTRTVAVRVLIENPRGRLKIGDYAEAMLQVPLVSPQADDAEVASEVLAVPRDAVLYAGDISVVYVETVPGRFEIRNVTLGPAIGQDVVIGGGLKEGDLVASRGNFLIDSQMQLAGNPSLVDPLRLKETIEMVARKEKHDQQQKHQLTDAQRAELMELPESEQQAAIDQGFCPVTMSSLGSMGVPTKVEVNGRTIYLCCDSCRERILASPAAYIAKLDETKRAEPDESSGIPEMGEITEIEP